MKPSVQLPEKELRFTRSGQAVVFWLLAAMLAGTAVTLGLSSLYRDINPALPHPAWVLLPLAVAFFFAAPGDSHDASCLPDPDADGRGNFSAVATGAGDALGALAGDRCGGIR